MVYVDDIAIINEVSGMILKQIKESYSYLLKDFGEPKCYLRTEIGKQTGVFGDTWYISPDSYINKAITTEVERFGGKAWIPENSSHYFSSSIR